MHDSLPPLKSPQMGKIIRVVDQTLIFKRAIESEESQGSGMSYDSAVAGRGQRML